MDYDKIYKNITHCDLSTIKLALIEASKSEKCPSIAQMYLNLHDKLFGSSCDVINNNLQ